MFADKNKNSFSYYYDSDIVDRDPMFLEDMQEHLTNFPEIEWVEFPLTNIGYGSTIVEQANHEYLENNFSDNVVYFYQQLFINREEFFKDDNELIRLFFMVKNEYPAIDDELFCRKEYEALEEFLADEMRHRLAIDRVDFERAMSELELSAIDFARIDNDGSTVFAEDSDLDDLEERINDYL